MATPKKGAKAAPKPKAPGAAKAAPSHSNPGEAELRKLFGDDGILIAASDITDETPEVIPVSPLIDIALGGGIMTGTLVTLCGPAGCGKTTTAIRMAAQWQAMGRKVYVFSTEWRLNPRDLDAYSTLKPELIGVLRSTEKRHLTAQDFLKAADVLLKANKHIMIIFDSFSMIADADELGGDDYDQGSPAVVNRMVSKFCKRMTPVLPLNKNILVGIFHTYSNIGGKTAIKASVPTKVEFARSTGLYCKWAEPWKDKPGEDGKQIGQIAHWHVERSMLPGGFTGAKAPSLIRYGKGIDVNAELFAKGKELGMIAASGAWVELSFLGADPPRCNGKEKTIAYLDEHPEHADALYAAIRERLS